MNTAHFSHHRRIRPLPDRDCAAEIRDSLLVVSGVLAAAIVLLTAALVSDRLLFNDAVILEPTTAVAGLMPPALAAGPPTANDAFRQQKLEAKADELTAQF